MKTTTQQQPYIARMEAERGQLEERFEKFKAFIGSSAYEKLPEIEQELADEQLSAMLLYYNSLCRCIGVAARREEAGE